MSSRSCGSCVQESGEITYGKAFYRQYISMEMCGILELEEGSCFWVGLIRLVLNAKSNGLEKKQEPLEELMSGE